MSGYRGGYRGSYRYANNYGSERARQHIEEAQALERKYGPAFEQIKTLFLSLDNRRISALLDAYSVQYGISARKYASNTYYKWRRNEVKMSGQTMIRLFDLLPQFMTPDEKMLLIRNLREQTLNRLRRATVRMTVSDHSDLPTVFGQAIALVKQAGAIELPRDFYEVQSWLSQTDTHALKLLVEEAESYIATQRVADLLVQLANVSRLRQLAPLGLRLRVTTHFVIPTATLDIQFTKQFWKQEGDEAMASDDNDLIVRLQDLALRQEHQEGNLSFVDYVMRTMSPEEQAQIRAIAATEGLRTEILLKELQVKTLAARGDIQSVMDTATELKAKGHNSKISSEHQTASGVTKIEIDNKKFGCIGLVLFALALGGGATGITVATAKTALAGPTSIKPLASVFAPDLRTAMWPAAATFVTCLLVLSAVVVSLYLGKLAILNRFRGSTQ